MKIKNLSLTFVFLMITNIVSANDNSNSGLAVSDTLIFSLLVGLAVLFLMIIYAQVYGLKALLENRDAWIKKDTSKSGGTAEKATAIIAILFLSQSIYAQDGSTEPLIRMTDQMYWLLLSLNAFLFGIVVTLYFTLKGLIQTLHGEDAEVEEAPNTISKLSASLTDVVPIEEEASILMDHDYDGIRELDNNLPPWWKYGFYMTIVTAFIYFGYYHIGGGDLQLAEYEKEMIEGEAIKEAFAAQQANLVDEDNLVVVTDAGKLEAGKATYTAMCQVCHGAAGEGLVGPNFTDKYWKHGGGIADLYRTITVGIPEKGMISWESTLSPTQRVEVASYILTFQGTNPPNQKAAEGDLWEGDAAEMPPATEEIPVTDDTELTDEDA